MKKSKAGFKMIGIIHVPSKKYKVHFLNKKNIGNFTLATEI
jgi:hypothetical protein